MDLLACWYHNIGPFSHQQIAVQFLEGTYLVKAPIGSGKSFLFFDGPIFALYKWSTRPMVSRTSSSGRIQVLVEVHGSCWLICRELKQTKLGNDSVSTRLYRLDDVSSVKRVLEEQYGTDIVCHGGVALDELFVASSHSEEIAVPNQKELDQYIADLLPPKEVTLSASVLLQESDNIFEMTPAMRIAVFKELFSLLDMDTAKQLLTEEKKTLQVRRQVLEDTTALQQRFGRVLEQIRSLLKQRLQWGSQDDLAEIRQQWMDQPLFTDLDTLADKQINIQHFDLHGYAKSIATTYITGLETTIQSLIAKQTLYQSALEQRRSVQDKIVVLDRHYGELEKRLLTLKQALSSHHTDEKIQLQTKKTDLEQEIQSINTTLSLLLREHHELVGARFGVIQSRLDRMIQEAKSHQQELQYMQSEYAQLLTRRDELHTRQLELKQQIALLQSKREDALLFHCDKIAEPCPYVSLITKKTTHAIDDQEVFLTNELKTITDHTLPSLTKNIDELFSRQQQQEEKVSTYKALFQTFDRKKIQALLQEGVQKETALERVRGDWDVFHAILSSQEEKRQEYGRLEQELRLLEGQKKTHQQDLQRLDEQMRLLTVVPGIVDQLHQQIVVVRQVDTFIDQLGVCVEEYTLQQRQIQHIKAREEKVKELLQIFQRELLVVVLQDFLPVLEEVINTYLIQIVPFSLHFELPKTVQEDIELHIRIEDHQGKRAVKSLSGGQKAVLRLCWILAVSSLFKKQFLLLDETINSLDQDAIGRVATVLEEFVKKQEIKLFVVTHASQIQEMDLWTRRVEWSIEGTVDKNYPQIVDKT